jgi:DNA-binding CsgD family transcriptional regulator
LIVSGEPGIGKTALLRYAQEQASGMRVLRARGVEAETELAFAGLHELLGPVVDLLTEIPDSQAMAVRGALGLGPPVDARLLIAGGTLSLLAVAADQGPLLLLVDDAHWLDAESAAALVFAARRLEHDPVLLLFAARDGDPRRFEAPGVDELALAGLARDEAVALLSSEQLPGGVIAELHRATGGNPLALIELPRTLDEAQRLGKDPLPEPLPVTAALQRAFVWRSLVLSTNTRTALVVAAAEPSPELRVIGRACGALDVPLSALEDAEAEGLVTLTEQAVVFRHPLVRAALYHAADGSERRRAHRALAEAAETDGDLVRRAWHLAAAALEPDEDVAAALEAAGDDSIRRSGYLTASLAFERAAALTPDAESRARRLFRAAEAQGLVAYSDRALVLLEQALMSATSRELRFDIQVYRGACVAFTDPLAGAHLMLEDVALLEGDEPANAALLAALVAMIRLRMRSSPGALEAAVRAAEIASGAGNADPFVPFVAGASLLEVGRLREALPLLDEAVPLMCAQVDLAFGGLRGIRHMGAVVMETNLLLQVLLAAGDVDRASRCVETGLSWAASHGAAPFWWLTFAARLDYLYGRWTTASARLAEAMHVGRVSRYSFLWWQACMCSVQLAAAQGAEAELDAAEAQAAEATAAWGPMTSLAWIGGGRGLLALGRGRADEAAAAYERELPLDSPLKLYPEFADAIEAFMRAGRTPYGRELLDEFSLQASMAGWPWARARAAHLEALAAPTDEAFDKALALHERVGQPFPRARTRLAYGDWLRHSNRRDDSRAQLHAALESFEQLGAEPWAEQARAELRATGERVRRRAQPTLAELTPQELQVALLVTRGATNKEAAAQLFLSPKTIERHLGSIYAKLGVRSRTELAAIFAPPAPLPVSA